MTTAHKLSPDYVFVHLYMHRHRNEKKQYFSELKFPELKQHRFSEYIYI